MSYGAIELYGYICVPAFVWKCCDVFPWKSSPSFGVNAFIPKKHVSDVVREKGRERKAPGGWNG